jgi:hypothetical protein
MSELKSWRNVELEKYEAYELMLKLRDMKIQYETSEADNLIHFEINCTTTEAREIDGFLMNL